MGDNPRQMKFPYTFGAQIMQFPFKYYYKHSWMIKYSVYAALVVAPIIYQFQKLSYSPENVKKWAEIDRQTFHPDKHH